MPKIFSIGGQTYVDCTRCNQLKHRSSFGTHIKTKTWCKDCRSEADRQRRFNLTPERYAILLASQGGVCAICKNPETRLAESGRTVDLSVDHDHECCPGRESCGKCIRGLLCERCNRSIGLFEENADLLKSAIKYIRSNKSDSSIGGYRSRLGRAWNFYPKKRRLV